MLRSPLAFTPRGPCHIPLAAPGPRARRARRTKRGTGAPRAEPVGSQYEVLGLQPSATPEEIKARYRELAKATHPDVSGARDAAERFVAVRKAYEVLSQELLRAEHDQALGLASARNNDPRFARFNRWRAEVVPELRAQLRVWSDEVYSIMRAEAARWRALLNRARRAADAAAAAADALAARRGASGAAAVGGAGAGRFEAAHAASGGARLGAARGGGEPTVAPAWGFDDPDAADSGGIVSSSSDGGGGGGGASLFGAGGSSLSGGGDYYEELRASGDSDGGGGGGRAGAGAPSEALQAALAELWDAVRELRRGVKDGQACVQRQYDKRLEQVSARYRVYGEIVWYDVWEEAAGAWLADAERQLQEQAAELAAAEAAAHDLAARAER